MHKILTAALALSLAAAGTVPAEELAPRSRFSRNLSYRCETEHPTDCFDPATAAGIMGWSRYARIPIQLPLLGADFQAWRDARRAAMAIGMGVAFEGYQHADRVAAAEIRDLARRILTLDAEYDRSTVWDGSLVDVCTFGCGPRDAGRAKLLELERALRDRILAVREDMVAEGAEIAPGPPPAPAAIVPGQHPGDRAPGSGGLLGTSD